MAGQVKPAREPKRCARPGCPEEFVPSRKDKIYCSAKCKRRVQLYRHALEGR